jgi:flagellar basal-body rod modification protein FlgD
VTDLSTIKNLSSLPAYGSASSSSSSSSSTTNNNASSLGIKDFLQLMSTQLQNQDPTKPLDSSAFVAQLAQFSTVSGIDSMNTTLQTLSDSMRASQTLTGVSMVGHQVLATSDTANLTAGSSITGAVTVPGGASSVALQVKDSSGAVVRQVAIPAIAGQQGFTWDGLSDSGAQEPSGTYTLSVTANVGGAGQSLATSVVGTVSSVSINAATNAVTLNTPELGPVAMSAVQQVG